MAWGLDGSYLRLEHVLRAVKYLPDYGASLAVSIRYR